MGKRILASICFCLLVHVGLLAGDASGQEVVKVGILPFKIYAPDREKLAGWPEQLARVISRELAKAERIILVGEERIREALARAGPVEIDERLAREIGRTVDTDYIITGSITQVDGSISLDARLLDVFLEGTLSSAFAVGKVTEGLDPIAQKLARELTARVLKEELISKVMIEGSKVIEESAIRSQVKMKQGDVFSPRVLREDLKSIYQLGYFQDVRAEKRDWDRGMAIVFVVEEKPVVRAIKISGNKALKTSEIQEVISLRPRAILDLNAVKESVNKILRKYHDEAYFSAEVRYELETPRKGDVIVHFKIVEHKKIRIKSITFSGNLHFSDTQLKKVLPETKERSSWSWVTKRGAYKDDILERDLDAIMIFYLQRGFLQAKVGKPVVTHDSEGIMINIPVDEGRQFKVGKVDIQGDLILPKEEMFKWVDIYVGEIVNRDKMRDTVTKLNDLYADRGYAFVDISPHTTIRADQNLADLTFEIQKGRQVYIERINILGNTKTRDKVIRRYLSAVEGELYSLSALKASRQNLNRLGYFKEVNINTKKGSADDKLEMNVQVEEGNTGSISVGGGYSTIDKFVGTVQIRQSNLFGRGQTLSLVGQIGGISQMYNLGFTEPSLFDSRVSGGVDLYNIRRIYDAYTVQRVGGGLRFGFPVAGPIRAHLSYKYETVTVSNVSPYASFIIQQSVGTSTTSSVTGTMRRDTRDSYMDPTQGSDNSVWLEYAGGVLGGTNYFTRYGANSGWWATPFWGSTFYARGRIGYIQGRDDHNVPLFERYRLGGIYTVRGFKTWSIGPLAPNGEVIGGDKELLFNFEWIFPLVRQLKIKGLVFFDAGNAWDVAQPFLGDPLRTSVGFGFRWLSPMGPLRLEWGYNLFPKPGESQSSWDFAMGTMF
jgi:outer membrane protein insertion porin family